jgi:O-methyltransferase/methyltransferase family protein
VAQGQEAAPERILDLAYAFWRSKALFAAVELDVFTMLAPGPLELPVLARRTGVHPRGAEDFFDSLVALGLLQRNAAGRYVNAPEADLYLVRNGPTYLGGLLLHLNARHYRNWDFLPRALATGKPQSGLGTETYEGFYANDDSKNIFLTGMTAGSLLAARALAQAFPWDRYKTFLDIGTAQGGAAVEIARAQPHLSGGGFDLPQVEPAFMQYVRDNHLEDRLRFHSGDFFTDPLPRADVMVMGRILHNWHSPARTNLLAKAFQGLPCNGALIVYDPLIDDDRRKAHGLLSSLNMLIETASGSEYTVSDCKSWMSQAGFGEIEDLRLDDLHTAVFGFKTNDSPATQTD